MKILITTGIYPPDIGGPATYSKLLFDELPKRGVDVSVLSFGEVRGFPKGISHIYFLLKLLLRSRSVDIIFAQDTVSVGFPSLCASKILGKKLFVRVPGDHSWEQATQRFGVTDSIDDFQNKKYGWKIELLRKIQRITVNGAHTVIAPSLYFRDLVSKWVENKDKVFCIYNGIDLSVIPQNSNTYKSKTIISAGRLVPWKGFEGLIRCLTLLPDYTLSVAGSGPFQEELMHAAQEMGVIQRVHFLGQVPQKELIRKIQDSEVFVLNTAFESFSFQIVEAMAAGTPVITTNIGNLKEIVDDQKNGVLVNPDDVQAISNAITQLATNNEFRKRIIAEAHIKAQKFSIEHTLDNVMEILKRI